MTPTPTIRMTALWRQAPTPVPDFDLDLKTPSAVQTPAPAGSVRLPAATPERADGGAYGLPEIGESYHGFQLVEELGRGSFARVYLAEQVALAGRHVALKVTLRPTREPDRLARLQHPNIVPVYSVHTHDRAQVICMPFRGRRTLADLLRQARPSVAGSGRRTAGMRKGGSTTVIGTRHGSEARPLSGAHRRPATDPALADTVAELVGNPDAVLRLIRQLAGGLAHAHDRGILHLDLKPANVLIADSGEPMLLDFNLSLDTSAAGRELVGGTIPYMAPEQINDLRTRGNGGVDPRTDLYGLGVVAYELMTGCVPFTSPSKSTRDYDGLLASRLAGPPRLRAKNPSVSPAADAIVRKLLAPAPGDRYRSAADLCEDLDRHLADRPLRHAADTSVRERVRKWRRRHPKALIRLTAVACLAAACAASVVGYRQSEARAATVASVHAKEDRAAVARLRLDLVLPNNPKNRERGVTAATTLLARYGLPDDPDWQSRSPARYLPADERAALAGDLGEVLLLLAHAGWQDARAKADAERTAAAEAGVRYARAAGWCFPPEQAPPALARQLATFEAVITGGEPAEVPALQPVTARDHLLDGVALQGEGKFAAAFTRFQAAIASQPDDGTAHYCLADCLYHMGKFSEAAERFDMAQALLPADSRPAVGRGLAFSSSLNFKVAEEEFTRAISLDPTAAEAFMHRGRIRTKLSKFGEADTDLTAALERGGPEVIVRLLRAEARRRLKDEVGAKTDEAAAMACRPATPTEYLVRGTRRMVKDPHGALHDLRTAATGQTTFDAYQNQALLLGEKLGRKVEALALVDRAIELHPESAKARLLKAILLAKLGRRDEAHREAELAASFSKEPAYTYARSCVYAVTSPGHPDDLKKSLALLRQAFRNGYKDVLSLKTDPNLDAIRFHPEFQTTVAAVTAMFREY